MAKAVHRATVDDDGLAHALAPRLHPVAEQRTGPRTFTATDGPFASYERVVEVEPAGDGHHRVTEVTSFRIAAPIWGVVFTPLYRRSLRRGTAADHTPFWAPPDRLDARAATVLAVLCTASLIAGYLGTLITQTITYAAAEFGVDKTVQGDTLALTRVGVLFSLVLVTLADRRGRRRLLLACTVFACLTAAAGAFVPSMLWLGVAQTVARSLSTAMALLITIIAAEEMPAGSRAYAISVMALTAALGAGMVLWVLPVSDQAPWAWRIVYLVPLLGLALVPHLARHLPESRRFLSRAADRAEKGEAATRVRLVEHLGRLVLLSLTLMLVAMFSTPASQFQNEFLRDERAFSAARISLFTVATGTPGFIGIVIGGRMSDVRGRRAVAAFAVFFGSLFTVLAFRSHGWPLWAFTTVGIICGAAAIPSLQVYGPELFPTALRGRANGVIQTVTVAGSALGLLIAGRLADLSNLGSALTWLFLCPAAMTVAILIWYPETAHRELEELNPEDLPPPPLPLV